MIIPSFATACLLGPGHEPQGVIGWAAFVPSGIEHVTRMFYFHLPSQIAVALGSIDALIERIGDSETNIEGILI